MAASRDPEPAGCTPWMVLFVVGGIIGGIALMMMVGFG